jgi:hypothetical protein
MGAHIDVVAPGAQVLSSVPGEHDPTGYAIDTGTSMSAAYVSGIASMLLSFDQTLYNDDVEQLIRLSAKDRGPAGWDQQYGTGIVSLRNALALLDSPYTLLHRSASGGTPLGPVPIAGQVIYDVPGLASYPHPADRYEVRRAVAFSSLYAIPPSVWGRGVATTGFNSDGLNFAVGFAEPVPGSISKTGCTLRTYVYEMFTIPDHSSLGYFPCAPGNVNLAYTVHGIEDHLAPTSTVGAPNGGETVQAGQSATIEWEVTDEYLQGVECTILLDLDTAGGTIVWQVAEGLGVDESGNGSYSWSIPGGQPGDDSYRIRVIAYDTNNHQGVDVSDAYFTINPWSGKGGPPPPPDPCEAPCMPVSWTPNFVTDLLPVSPNPFNPQTRLRFTLAGPDEISLRVYDVHGRLVATVVDGVRQQGLHEIPWNGRDSAGRPLPSGVYFAALNADRRVFTQKIVILK